MYHVNVLHPAKITMDDTTHKVEKETLGVRQY